MEASGDGPTLFVVLGPLRKSQGEIMKLRLAIPSILFVALGACSSSGHLGADAGAQGGAMGSGGATGAGGTSEPSANGGNGLGGTTLAAGGSSGIGAAGGVNGSGGKPAAGGSQGSGGAVASGGNQGTGGASLGVGGKIAGGSSAGGSAAGGAPAAGGSTGASGGTTGTPNAAGYLWQSVAIRGGGFVPGLVFSTVAKDILYARTDMAGAYRWDAASYGWMPIMDWLTRPDMKYIGVESIAADPVDANVVYMAIGTYIGSNGQIIRSADRGDTWTRYNIGVTMGGNADGRSLGERLMVDPNKTSILYFGSRTAGLWKSTDSAATWAKVASFPVTGTNPYGLSFVVFDKTSGTAGSGSSTIYVGVAATTAGTNLYRSTDAGATWTLVAGTNPPSGMMPHHGVLASDGNLWIAYNSSSGPNSITSGAVWKLNTATDAWTNVNPAGHGGGIGGISVSASDPNYALASTLDWWAPDEMYRTTNGGTSWTAIGRNATHDMNGAEYLCFGPANCTAPSAAGWAGDIEIDPFNQSRAFYVTGQGVWSSKNSDAASGIVWSFEDKNFEETVGLDLTSSVKTAIFAVVGDIGIIRSSTTALDTPSPTGMVTNPKFGNGNSVDFAGLNPNIVADTGTGTQSGGYSTDNGLTWKPFASQAGGSKIAVGADGSVFVWGTNYSTNNGASWTACTGLTGGPRVASDRVNPKKFYAFAGGTLYASSDGAATFTAATTGLAGSGRAAAVFGMEGEVWVAAGANLYHSKSSGAGATKVAAVSQVYSVGFGKAAPGNTYPAVYIIGTVSGATGVFRSNDQGATWLQVNDAQHQYGQMDNVAGDEDYYGRVFVTTQGRGIPYGQPASGP
jgi:hypothetical protein